MRSPPRGFIGTRFNLPRSDASRSLIFVRLLRPLGEGRVAWPPLHPKLSMRTYAGGGLEVQARPDKVRIWGNRSECRYFEVWRCDAQDHTNVADATNTG